MAFTSETFRRSRYASATLPRFVDGLRRRAVRADRATLAISAILLSSLIIALSDVISKILTSELPPVEVAWLRFTVFACLTMPLVFRRGGVGPRVGCPLALLARGVASGAATGLAISGFGLLPVAEATAIGFVAPVFVTALAVLILGEHVGMRRWAAALVGLAGVLIVVQPGAQSFQVSSLLPLSAALASAFATIATRWVRAERAGITLVSTAVAGMLVITPPTLAVWITPTWQELALSLLSGALATASNVLQVYAYRCAPASMVVPFSYTQMIWAGVFGISIFGYVPSSTLLLGAGVIAASGVYTAYRERRRGRTARKSASCDRLGARSEALS